MNGSHTERLPYTDTKPQGSADFYFATNATFRFLIGRLGLSGWRLYLEDLGRDYFAPVNRSWRTGGLAAIAGYWRAFFAAEPGAVVVVKELADRVEVDVQECPAIKHLRTAKRPIVPEFCQHCYFLGAARAAEAGMTMRLCGGNGACRHIFAGVGTALPPQDLAQIKEATP